jgi:hypothetical protein
MEIGSLMDATASIDMAMWSAAAIGTAMAIFRMIGEFAEVAFDGMDIGHRGKNEKTFFDGFLIVLAVLLSGFCIYQLVTDKAAAIDSLLFWFGAAAAILCGSSGMILLRANSNSNDS